MNCARRSTNRLRARRPAIPGAAGRPERSGRATVDDRRTMIYEERAASILTHNDRPDVPFDWSVNPYRGCRHACAYCFARTTHTYLDLGAGADFESRLIVKVNAPELLAESLRRPGWCRAPIAFSGVTDCYQPAEEHYRLTRRCLEVCRDLPNPAGVATKSDLVTRDADVLAELHRRSCARVLLSVAFAADDDARRIEPGAPSPSRRFAAMSALHRAGVPVGLLIAPVIPGLNDRDIPALLARAAECGASVAELSPLRPPLGVADVFLSRLRRAWPDRAGRVEARLRELGRGRADRACAGVGGAYWESVERLFETIARRVGIERGSGRGANDRAMRHAAPRQLRLF